MVVENNRLETQYRVGSEHQDSAHGSHPSGWWDSDRSRVVALHHFLVSYRVN
ncbi:protein of unknown function [uncultured Woeseiaceae bacterium]|uniref:Uncharacterized protein n=1 Tax=uncultured Woeseiaceae bacterium TaxID=1983305 RepID=A0A7D9H3K6_9GAMM|nr:protein of unknown function [uncultured Woeseiaceae bacterium]